MWGFITVSNDILVNTFQEIFELSKTQRSFVQLFFFGAYFVVSLAYYLTSSITGIDPINKVGYKKGMSISLAICGLGCLSFYPAASYASYPAFLFALFLLASGVTGLQICANPYATILGPEETSSSRLNLAQGFNSLGTTLGPLVGTFLIYFYFAEGKHDEFSVAKTYMVYGLFFILLAILTSLSKMPDFKQENTMEKSDKNIFRHKQLTLGILAIFCYVGTEVTIGTWLVEYAKNPKIGGWSEEQASLFLPYFWGGIMYGRLIASFAYNQNLSTVKKWTRMITMAIGVMIGLYFIKGIEIDSIKGLVYETPALSDLKWFFSLAGLGLIGFYASLFNPARSLVIFSSINIVLLSIGINFTGDIALWSIIGTGIFLSIGWSNIFSLAIKKLGKETSQGSSLLVMAVVGGALFSFAQAWFAEKYGIQFSFIIPAIGIIYLLYYGVSGHKIKEL